MQTSKKRMQKMSTSLSLLGLMFISRLIPPGNKSREGSLRNLSVIQSPVVGGRFHNNTGVEHITKVQFQGK